MNPSGLTDQWKAPVEDGRMLLWPQAEQILTDTHDNHRRLADADAVLIQNVPMPELRQALRTWVGHDDARPLVAVAHQTELYHPGVWIKNVLVDALARRLDGAGHHYAVDTDAPKHLQLRWPGGAAPLTDDPRLNTAAWSGLLDPPTPRHVQEIERMCRVRFADHWGSGPQSGPYEPMLFQFMGFCRRLALEGPTLSAMLVNAAHQVDWDLGLRHHALLASPIWSSEPYLALVHHVMARADSFAADYNACLAEYRQVNRVRNPGRPMPDLRISPEACEVPFWVDHVEHGRRQRAMVVRRGGRWCIQLSDGEELVLDAGEDGWTAARKLQRWLTDHQVRLSPRALSLTMVIRLLLADQFVHGIGGGRYDQVTDRLIHRHFRLEPPRFAVTTATLFHPLALQRERVCLPCLRQEGHRLRHNILGEQKLILVSEIGRLPRFSPQRREIYQQMHRQLATASDDPRLQRWQRKYEQAQQRWREEQTLFDRELFYALHPKDRLMGLIEQVRNSVGVE